MVTGELGVERGSEDVRFSVAGDAGGAVEFGEEGPDRLGAKGDAEIAGLDAIAGVEIEIALLAGGF